MRGSPPAVVQQNDLSAYRNGRYAYGSPGTQPTYPNPYDRRDPYGRSAYQNEIDRYTRDLEAERRRLTEARRAWPRRGRFDDVDRYGNGDGSGYSGYGAGSSRPPPPPPPPPPSYRYGTYR